MVAETLSRVDRISAEVRQVDVNRVVSRAVLTVLAAVLWLIGALPGKLVTGMVWAAVAIRVGYRDGRGLPPLDRSGGST